MKKLFILIVALLFTITGCSPKSNYPAEATEFVLNTISTITIYSAKRGTDAQEVINDAFKLCREYEALLSRTIETSEISKINNAKGKPVEVSDDTAEIIELALKYSQLSNGGFDVTIEPLSSIWDFQSQSPEVPDENAIKEAIKHVGYENLNIDENIVTLKDEHSGIDLGAIAKGYIADKIKEYLVEQGVTGAIINLGGNVLTLGGKSDKEDFKIGIRQPEYGKYSVIGAVALRDKSVVTSGIYERYFEQDGSFYHHILNTETGYPIENDLLSVTIISDSSVEGDALSTACFSLGLEKALELINSIDNVDAVFVDKNQKVVYSDGIGKTVEFKLMK